MLAIEKAEKMGKINESINDLRDTLEEYFREEYNIRGIQEFLDCQDEVVIEDEYYPILNALYACLE